MDSPPPPSGRFRNSLSYDVSRIKVEMFSWHKQCGPNTGAVLSPELRSSVFVSVNWGLSWQWFVEVTAHAPIKNKNGLLNAETPLQGFILPRQVLRSAAVHWHIPSGKQGRLRARQGKEKDIFDIRDACSNN